MSSGEATIALYGPIGRCIYCGATRYDADTAKLTEEHIIPLGLKGADSILEASCRRCQTITARWEQKWLRGNIDPVRQFYGLQDKRRQQRRIREGKTTIPIFLMSGKKIEIPAEDYPATPIFPHLGAPRAFNPLPPFEDPNMWYRAFEPNVRQMAHKYGIVEYATVSVDLWAMMRVMAKIAHAYTVSELGLDGFEPGLPNYIIGDNDGARHFYVGTDLNVGPVNEDILHSIIPEEPTSEQWDLIVIRVRLFANLGAPTFRVATGYRLAPTKPLELQLAEAGALHNPLGMPAHYRPNPPTPPGLWDPTAPSLRGVHAQKPARLYRMKINLTHPTTPT